MNTDPEETYSPEAVTGKPFDELVAGIMKAKPDRPKKKSRPRTAFHITSTLKKSDLHGKKVEYSILTTEGRVLGIGLFDVSQPSKTMAVNIHSKKQDVDGKWHLHITQLPQSVFDKIQPHPDEAVAEFLIVFP